MVKEESTEQNNTDLDKLVPDEVENNPVDQLKDNSQPLEEIPCKNVNTITNK